MNCKYLPSITATMSPSCRSRRGKAAVSLLGGCCLSPLRQRTMTGEYLASSDAISLNRGRSAGFISQHRCIRLLISLGAATASLSLSPFFVNLAVSNDLYCTRHSFKLSRLNRAIYPSRESFQKLAESTPSRVTKT